MICVRMPEYLPESDLNNNYLQRRDAQSRIQLFHQKEIRICFGLLSDKNK
jgi:hypothetical protein